MPQHEKPAHVVYKEMLAAQRKRRIQARIAAGAKQETCAYCGHHTMCEWRVIRAAKPGEASTRGENGTWVADPCCEACHIGPQPRIHGHFCAAGQEPLYLRRAGSSNLGV